MNRVIRVNKAVSSAQEEHLPQLQIVPARNGSIKANKPSAPLALPSRLHQRPVRAELAVLGWNTRAARLAGGKQS
jgi:hypothetical protein